MINQLYLSNSIESLRLFFLVVSLSTQNVSLLYLRNEGNISFEDPQGLSIYAILRKLMRLITLC